MGSKGYQTGAHVDRDVKPENAMHEAAPTTAATREERRAERERRRDAERAVAKQHGDEARRLHSPEAIARHMPTARIEVFEGGKLARVIEPSEIAGDPRPGLPTRDELLLRVASLEAELAALRGAS